MKGLSEWRDDVGSRVNNDVNYAQDQFSKGQKIFDDALKQSLKVLSERVSVQSQSATINGLIVREKV